MKRTGPTNVYLRKLIADLKKIKTPIWKRVAEELNKPSRQRREVNLYHIEKNIEEGEIALVPGKVLGDGMLIKNVKVAAWNFSESAKEKLGSNAITLEELAKKNPKGNKVRILG